MRGFEFVWACRSAEGAGGGGGEAPVAGAPLAPTDAPSPAAPDHPGPHAYRPDGLREDLAGASDRETIDKLWGAYRDATTAGEAADYVVAWDGAHKDVLTAAFGTADDPLYAAARDAALKHGIAPKAFGAFLTDTFGPALAQGIIPAPFNPARELEAWGKAIGVSDKAELGRQLSERQAWTKGLGAQMGLSEAGRIELDVLTDTAAGLELVDKLRELVAGEGVKVSDQTQATGGGLSKADLAQLDNDPRIDPSSSTYDPQLRGRYDAAYRRHYG